MSRYGIKINKADQRLINITSTFPEAVEAFAFIELPDDKVQVFTDNKDRIELWIKDLTKANKTYEVIGL